MVRTSFLGIFFVVTASVIVYSGQQSRPYVPLQQRQIQQRQSVPAEQRLATPPRPATASANTTQSSRQTPTPPTVPAPVLTHVPSAPASVSVSSETVMPSFFLLPEDMQFPEAPAGASRTITLFGDPRAEGLYVTRTLIPKGVKTIPHTHPDARTVTVMSGVCYYGRGEVFDAERTVALPPGSFFTEPAGTPHYIWAKEEDIIVQTTAIGPSGTQIVPAGNVKP